MALAEDASTPAAVRSAAAGTGTSLTTASFTPPANSLVVAVGVVEEIAGAFTGSPTITMSGTGGLTWSTGVFLLGSASWAYTGIYYAQVGASPAAQTVTMTRSEATGANLALAVRVLTGASATQNGATYSANLAGTPAYATITPTQIGSELYAAAGENNSPTWTVVSGTTAIDYWSDTASGVNTGIAKLTNMTTALTSTQVGWTGANTTDTSPVIGFEVVPAAAAVNRPRPVSAVTRVPLIRAANF